MLKRKHVSCFASALGVSCALLVGFPVWAETTKSAQPYIDSLKEQMEDSSPPSYEGYTETLRQRLAKPENQPKEPAPADGHYIESLKQSDPERFEKVDDGEGYSDRQKTRLGTGAASGAIAAVQEGRSELQLKRGGEIHHAMGIRIGAGMSREVTAASAQQSFARVYGDGWAPDLGLFYEFQPIHSEWYGSLGIVAQVGASWFKANGRFEVALYDASRSNVQFPERSNVQFTFLTVPASLGVNYRLNVFRYVRPFVLIAPTLIGYAEYRSDGRDTNKGTSRALYGSVGAAFLLDWISRKSSWDLYAEEAIKHYYLTVEYSRLQTLSGDVKFTVSGLNLGFTFEF